LIILVG